MLHQSTLIKHPCFLLAEAFYAQNVSLDPTSRQASAPASDWVMAVHRRVLKCSQEAEVVPTLAAKVGVIAHNGARIPVEAPPILVPLALGVLVRGAAVVEHAVPQHFEPAAAQLGHAPVHT